MKKYLIKRSEIEAMTGREKKHFLNSNAQVIIKSLSNLTGITGLGFHLVEILSGFESTEYHMHFYEDECIYILSGTGVVLIGDKEFEISKGDYIGFPAKGEAHMIKNTGTGTLQYILVGQRLDHDVAEYPNQKKRLFRNKGLSWDLVDIINITDPKS